MVTECIAVLRFMLLPINWCSPFVGFYYIHGRDTEEVYSKTATPRLLRSIVISLPQGLLACATCPDFNSPCPRALIVVQLTRNVHHEVGRRVARGAAGGAPCGAGGRRGGV